MGYRGPARDRWFVGRSGEKFVESRVAGLKIGYCSQHFYENMPPEGFGDVGFAGKVFRKPIFQATQSTEGHVDYACVSLPAFAFGNRYVDIAAIGLDRLDDVAVRHSGEKSLDTDFLVFCG